MKKKHNMCDTPRRLLAIVVVTSLLSFAAAAASSSSNTYFQTLLCLKLHLSSSPASSPLGSWAQNSSLHFCSWPGVTCSNASQVVALDLEKSSLDGQIPPCIANLTLLSRIHFPGNLLNGHLPAQLGQLSRLTYLNFSSNSLTGSIPSTLSSTTSPQLQVIDLGRAWNFGGERVRLVPALDWELQQALTAQGWWGISEVEGPGPAQLVFARHLDDPHPTDPV